MQAIKDLRPSLPGDLRIEPLYAQKSFIDRAIENVIEALRDGGILVVIILFLFLMNFRTTFITLTAIPIPAKAVRKYLQIPYIQKSTIFFDLHFHTTVFSFHLLEIQISTQALPPEMPMPAFFYTNSRC